MELKQARTESRTGDRRIWKLDEHLLRGLRKRSLAPWLLLVIATIPAMFFINFEPHPWSLAVRGNPKSAELDRLSREIGTSFSPLLLVSRGSTREQAIDRDRRAVNLLRPGAMRSEIVTIESISSWLPSKEQQQTNIDYLRGSADLFSSRRFVRDYDALVLEYPDRAGRLTPEYRDLIATYLDPVVSPLEVDDLPPQLDRHVLELNDEYVAVSYLYLKRFPWATGALDRLRDTLRLLRFDELLGTRLEGEALNSGAHSEALTVDLARAMAVVSVLVILILWLQFGSLAPVGLCLLPSICGACAALVAMSLFRIELNMLTLSIAPLLIGIGIDDGIHIVERLRMRQERSQIFREAGTCMAITTVTTAAAFMCMLLGQFAGVRESGLLGATGLVVSFLAAVHAVPLLAERWKIFS